MPDPARAHVGLPTSLPLTFQLDEDSYTLPHLDTRTWLDALVLQPPGCWFQLIPAQLAADDGDRLFARLTDPHDPLDLDDLEHAAITVLGQVCGVDFFAACRLAALAYGAWMIFDGWAVSVGFDPLREPIARVLAAVYTWRRALCTKESELARLDAEIWQPAPVTTASGRPRQAEPPNWTDEQESASFMAALSNLGGTRGRG